ncbi:Tyrosine-protein kinase HTK16 [Orchesella cincta]|uniref:Tyrosine-protein kinase HTK16 n=1 Tax=Orchesella cincta TaxID=48709 RepID=A0A1D2MXI9_ORCCI|nr:Tyrosine-protein kinase HTK16 [Orchesella cincta]
MRSDDDLKNEFEILNLDWDNETDSAALKYLRKLKGTKPCSSLGDKALSETKMGETNVAKDENYLCSEQLEDESSDSDEQFSDAETVYMNAPNEAQVGSSGEMKVKAKVYPKTALRGDVVVSRNIDGFYKQVSKGYVSGFEVAVKVINATEKEMGDKEIRALRKIYSLNHRNLISMFGILDNALDQPMQLLFDYRDFDTSLLKFVRDDKNPSDYATFGKFSLDVANACEYLHKIGVVHGSLAARNVIIRTATSKHDTKSKSHLKTHFNALISDYGIIQFTDGLDFQFFKASNGKVVPLRWVPEEILESGAGRIDYTRQSDVWAFSVMLWEMWTHGNVPYGNLAENWEVETHILNGCSPLTFQKPHACPKHILKVMESIFVDAAKRPTMSELVKTFVGFRTYRQEHPLEASKEKTSEGKMYVDTANASTKYVKYQNPREQQKQNGNASGSQLRQNHGGGNGFSGYSYDKGRDKGRPKEYFNSSSRPKLFPVLCPPSMLCGNNKSRPFAMQSLQPVPMNSFHAGMQMQTIHNQMTSLQSQIQALSCTVSRDHVPASSSVSVNIGSQRPCASTSSAYQRSLAQLGQMRPQSQRQGAGNRNTAKTTRKPNPKNNINKKKDQIQ